MPRTTVIDTGAFEAETERLLAEVDEPQAGQRLDRFLSDALPDVSRTRIQALIRDGHVRLAVALDYLGAAPLRVSPLLGATRRIEARAVMLQGQSQRQA